MLLPIGTDVRLHSPPIGNWILIGLNVLVYLIADGMDNPAVQAAIPPLHAGLPSLHEYLTYQFRHGDVTHLLGNMLFLWIFGNAVCDRMGSLNYVIFYLSSGVVAGVAFSSANSSDLVGASGSIAAVTTAFLVFYPRVHITLLLWFFIVTTLQLPAMLLIGLKIILWDNIISPRLDQGVATNVAYSAHLGGYAFGFLVSMGLLWIRALPRNQFDMVAIVKRWQRRSGMVAQVDFTPARPVRSVTATEVASRPIDAAAVAPALQLREDIVDRLAERDMNEAVRLYEQMLQLDPRMVLPRNQQLEVGNYYAQNQRYAEAARAYEAFLAAYPAAADAARVQLFAGLLYNRYLADYPRAVTHLKRAVGGLNVDSERQMAAQELAAAEIRLPPQ
ncbi:MAG: rhomboid family intramembrane serine protease [Planctomycetes bacterium]|nr:rhomboid family intramembrane serine protease [Planctomycetota bacterium]